MYVLQLSLVYKTSHVEIDYLLGDTLYCKVYL